MCDPLTLPRRPLHHSRWSKSEPPGCDPCSPPIRPLALAATLCLFAPVAFAQDDRDDQARIDAQARTDVPATSSVRPGNFRSATPNGEPDVLLDIPNLKVEELTLEVQNLRAHVALQAQLANLLSLSAGADVGIESVNLTIKGVEAQVLLKVRLDNVAAIIDRTLTTLDRNPEILTQLLDTVDNTVDTVGGVANTALQPGGVASQAVGTVGNTLGNVTRPGGVLSETVNSLGQTVQRTVDSAGNIVERTLDSSGRVISSRIVERAADRATGDDD